MNTGIMVIITLLLILAQDKLELETWQVYLPICIHEVLVVIFFIRDLSRAWKQKQIEDRQEELKSKWRSERQQRKQKMRERK